VVANILCAVTSGILRYSALSQIILHYLALPVPSCIKPDRLAGVHILPYWLALVHIELYVAAYNCASPRKAV
jgi:hypothetical protein